MAAETFGCDRCEKRWGGYRTCHCGTCHETFSGLTAFDTHKAKKVCGGDLASIGLVVGSRGYWGYPSDGTWWEID